MARKYGQIRVDMWADDHWRTLSPAAQHLYMLLLTSPTLSQCGVADWRPSRIAALAGEWDVEEVEAAASELIRELFILVDESTEEVLVRSFIKHDGLMNQPKLAASAAIAHAATASPALRGVVVHELNKLHVNQPELHGWKSEKATQILSKASIDPATYPLGEGAPKGSVYGSIKGSVYPKVTPSVKGSIKGSVYGSPTPAPAPAPNNQRTKTPSSADADGLFEKFWEAVPRRVGKKAARRKWDVAIKEVDPEHIIAAMARYSDSVGNHDPQFIVHPETWLNQGRWDDEITFTAPNAGGGWWDN